MEQREYALHNRLQLIRRFIVEYPEMPSQVVNSGVMEQLNQLIDDIATYGSTYQRLKERRVSAERKAIRQELLVRHLDPVIEIAALNDEMHEVKTIRRPPSSDHGAKFTVRIRGSITVLEPHADYFVKMGLRPSFLTELAALADAYDATWVQSILTNAGSIGATTGVKQSVKRSRKVVKALHGLLRHHSPASRDFSPQWEEVRKLPRHGSLSAPKNTPALPPADVRLALPAPADQPEKVDEGGS